MDVGVDEHRHHGLAGEIYARSPGRNTNVGGGAGLHDPRAIHDQRRALDRGAAIADDEPRALERGDAGRRRLRARRTSYCDDDTNGNGCGESDCIYSTHRSLPVKLDGRTLALLEGSVYAQRTAAYSGLIPAAATTLPHFA